MITFFIYSYLYGYHGGASSCVNIIITIDVDIKHNILVQYRNYSYTAVPIL